MAKKKSELSEAQKHTLDMRQKLETANKNHADKPTKETEKAVETAKANVVAAQKAENRDRFVRVAGGRVKKARTAIKNLANVAQPRSYTYTEEDVAKAEKVLTDAVTSTIAAMRSALANPGKAAKASDDFSF